MHSILKFGLIIAILCAIWQVIMAIAGWMTNPRLFNLFYLVVAIEIALLIWGLKQTASVKGYGGQVLAGAGMSVVAAVFMFLFSLVLTNLLFPGLLGEITAMQVGMLKAAGRTEAEVSAFVSLQKPLILAFQGFLGTVVTGLAASSLIALFLRKKI